MTGEALDFALDTLEIGRSGLRERLMDLYLTLNVFPDVCDALVRLKQAGMTTAILSDGSPQMLKAAVDGARINHLLDAVLSVEEVGIYNDVSGIKRQRCHRNRHKIQWSG